MFSPSLNKLSVLYSWQQTLAEFDRTMIEFTQTFRANATVRSEREIITKSAEVSTTLNTTSELHIYLQ